MKQTIGWIVILLSTCCGKVFATELTNTSAELYKIAAVYEKGLGVKQDYQQAFTLYCKSALMGDANSAYSLGFMYFNGRGVERNLGVAMRWFKQAADKGDEHALQMTKRFADVVALEDQSCQPEPVITVAVSSENSNPNQQKVRMWVEQIAPGYGIDPELVMAVIRAESGFNSGALSNKNAQGLMQLIPETAERFGVKDAWNPVQNIRGGMAYLHWLLRHFEGKVDWVLAAYNAGEGAVDRYKGIPPYQETQNYVKQILARYQKPQHPVPPEQTKKIDIIEQKT